MRAYTNHLIVEPEPPSTQSAGGIHLPTSQGEILKGKVVAKSPDLENWPCSEDTIYYHRITATEVEVDGQTFHVIKDVDILLSTENQ